jgi:hypothetical protein
MKVWIIKETGELDFEYDVPVGIAGEDMLPSVPYMSSAPPSVNENQVAIAVNGKWVKKPDYRGFQYWLTDGSYNEITEIGISPPDGFLTERYVSINEQALTRLDKITGPSGTIMRCLSAGIQIPAEWSAHISELRLIANGTNNPESLPEQPEYPQGS